MEKLIQSLTTLINLVTLYLFVTMVYDGLTHIASWSF